MNNIDLAARAADFMADRAMQLHDPDVVQIPAIAFAGHRFDAVVAASITGQGRSDLVWLTRAFAFPTMAHTIAWVVEMWVGDGDDDMERGELQRRAEDGDASVQTAIISTGLVIGTGETVSRAWRRSIADDGTILWDGFDMLMVESPMIEVLQRAATDVPDDHRLASASDSEWRMIAEATAQELDRVERGGGLFYPPGTLIDALAERP